MPFATASASMEDGLGNELDAGTALARSLEIFFPKDGIQRGRKPLRQRVALGLRQENGFCCCGLVCHPFFALLEQP
jgi:hypothetical protein